MFCFTLWHRMKRRERRKKKKKETHKIKWNQIKYSFLFGLFVDAKRKYTYLICYICPDTDLCDHTSRFLFNLPT